MKVEKWNGYNIRFVEIHGEWWAVLDDICKALNLNTWHKSQQIPSECLDKIVVPNDDHTFCGSHTRRHTNGYLMTITNEFGIYEALFRSQSFEARQFRRWGATVFQRLRRQVGLEGYEVMKMTDPDIQEDIDNILDTLFYDEKTGILMQSVTVAGGDVEQVPFEG